MRDGLAGSLRRFGLGMVPLGHAVFHQPLAQRADFFFPLADVHHPSLFRLAQLEPSFLLHLSPEHFQFLHRGAEPLYILISLVQRLGEAREVFLVLCAEPTQFRFHLADVCLVLGEFLVLSLDRGRGARAFLFELALQSLRSFLKRFQFGARPEAGDLGIFRCESCSTQVFRVAIS